MKIKQETRCWEPTVENKKSYKSNKALKIYKKHELFI